MPPFPPGRPMRRLGIPRLAARRMIRRALAPGPMRVLAGAHQSFAAGRYAEAAAAFENLARSAQAEGIPHAPRLFLQAARAHWRAGQAAHGMDLLRTALDMLAAAGAVAALAQVMRMASAELESLGLGREAAEARSYAATLPGWDNAAAPAPVAGKPVLPTHCPQCGGSVRSDEVEWIDDRTAECAYCGSPLRPNHR